MNRKSDRNGTQRARTLVAALLAGTALAGGFTVWSLQGVATAAVSSQSDAPVVVSQAGFADLAAKVKPAVVNIATSMPARQSHAENEPSVPPGFPFGERFRHFFGHEGGEPKLAQGSGFVIDPSGYVVTNNHVVDDAVKITVTLDDGRSLPAKVVGRDDKTDLALLKIEADKPLSYVTFGDSDKVRIGDWVIAVGNPFGLGGTVTAGIVSANGRDINEGPYDDFLQIDAPINPGNSGGPLFDQSGQVVGIDTAIFSPNGGSVGIGFAIPSNVAMKVVAQLREHGTVERGWLGVQMQAMTEPLAKAIERPNADGVLIAQVEPDSPAARAKLEQGDVLIALDGKPIKNPHDLAVVVANAPDGALGKLTVWRNGHELTVEVTFAAQSKEQSVSTAEQPVGEPVGLQLGPLTSEARSELNLGPNAKGVMVEQVMPNSRAAESGMRPGDVIVRIGNDPVATPSEAVAKIREAQQDRKEAVALVVMRDSTPYYVALQLAVG